MEEIHHVIQGDYCWGIEWKCRKGLLCLLLQCFNFFAVILIIIPGMLKYKLQSK